jgi:hypothetical protein
MSEIKTLADQLRHSMKAKPGVKPEKLIKSSKKAMAVTLNFSAKPPPLILQEIINYDASKNTAMVHVKLDPDTARTLGQFKLATGIDNIKLVAFAVRHLFENQPELKTHIKNFILNLDL